MTSRWIITGTPVSEAYPCRCGEAKYGRCSPVFCPCSGRTDPPHEKCCAVRHTPAVADRAQADYAARRARVKAAEAHEEQT